MPPRGAAPWAGPNRQQFVLMAAGLVVTCCIWLVLSGPSGDARGAAPTGMMGRLRASAGRTPACSEQPDCRLEFLGYEPSNWETLWMRKADELKEKICRTMLKGQNRELTDAWMEAMPEVFDGKSVISESAKFQNTSVWSQYMYRNTCGGDVRQPIEPLVGLFRHPTSHGACGRPDRPEFIDHQHDGGGVDESAQTIENKGYMVLQPLSNDTIAALYPGRKYLFDLGTGAWQSSSIAWLTKWYGQKGIVFDEMWGWELKLQNITDYWEQFPAEISEKMHFRNIGVPFAKDAPDNPLNILRRIFRKGDYVVIKLDIDNAPIELALMDQLEDDVISMIGEFYFEQHFDCPELSGAFGKTGVRYAEVYERFTALRQKGLRIHYWP